MATKIYPYFSATFCSQVFAAALLALVQLSFRIYQSGIGLFGGLTQLKRPNHLLSDVSMFIHNGIIARGTHYV